MALSSRLARNTARVHANQFNLSAPEWRIVAVLGQQGAISTSTVIGQTLMDKVRVSRAVAKLLKAGLVTRESDPRDRRLAVLDLTQAGREVHEQIVPLIKDAETEIMAALTQTERETLGRVLTKIEVYLDQTGPDADNNEPTRPAPPAQDSP